MEPIRKTPRGPPVGYVIDNHRYITVAEGTRIIGTDLICKKTLWNYAKAGHDPASGVDLGVIRFPLLRTGHQAARSDKEFRYLVREDRVLILRDILRDFRTHRKGSLSDATLADMRDAAVSRVRATRRLFSPTV
jgi:hypothetical protein